MFLKIQNKLFNCKATGTPYLIYIQYVAFPLRNSITNWKTILLDSKTKIYHTNLLSCITLNQKKKEVTYRVSF